MQKLLRFFPFAILLVAATVFSYNIHLLWPFTVDDAFISFRYAEHLSHYGNILWNLGEPPVEGYTSFLELMLLTGGYLLHLPFIVWSKLIGIFSIIGIGLIFFRFALTQRNPSYSLVIAILYAFLLCDHVTAVHAISGLETALYFFLLFSTLVLFALVMETGAYTKRFALCCLLVALTRPEANLYNLIMLISAWIYLPSPHKKPFISDVLVFYVLPGFIYFLWRFYYFQTFFPLPFYVKFEHNGFFPGIYTTTDFLCYYLPLWFVMLVLWKQLFQQHKTVVITYAVIFFSGILFNLHTLQLMGYCFRFTWPLLSIVLASGLLLKNASPNQQKLSAIFILLALILSSFQNHKEIQKQDHVLLLYANGLQKIHIPLGKSLNPIENHQYMVTCDAGAIPFYSKWPTLDSCALNNKIIATHVYSRDKTAEYIFAQKPRMVILISLDPHKNVPLPQIELLPLYRYALKAHMQILKIYRFYSNYYWIMGYPNDKALIAALNLPHLPQN